MLGNHARVVFCEQPPEYVSSVVQDCELVRVEEENIGINEVRALISEAFRQPKEGFSQKEILLTGFNITSEAQQSALKILEEPPKNTAITIVLPSGTQLLDTVLSRVQIEHQTVSTDTKIFSDWLQLSYTERIAEIEKRVKSKDTQWMQVMKSGLIQFCSDNKIDSQEILRELEIVVENLLTRGASNKMLLEHLALSVPLTR